MELNYLFIGGIADGNWRLVKLTNPGLPSARVRVKNYSSKIVSLVTNTEPCKESYSKVKVETYRREELCYEAYTWYFYIPVRMTTEEGLNRLISGYRKGGK